MIKKLCFIGIYFVLFVNANILMAQNSKHHEETQELLAMREKVNDFLNNKILAGEQKQNTNNDDLKLFRDSLLFEIANLKLEIESLKNAMAKLSSANTTTPEIVDTKFENILTVLYFEVGSYNLSNDYKTLIKNIVKQNPDKVLQLVAYTDWVGNNEFNQRLSDLRANSVQNELLLNGFSIKNIKIYAKGKMSEENQNLSAKECRRVEIRY